MQNKTVAAILTLLKNLSSSELIALNQAVVSQIKDKVAQDHMKAAEFFSKGDVVSYKDTDGKVVFGVVIKKNKKTLRVVMQGNYYINIPASQLCRVKKPSKELVGLRKSVAPTYEEMHEMMELEFQQDRLILH